MKHALSLLPLVVGALTAACATAPEVSPEREAAAPTLVARVEAAPAPFTLGGLGHLAWELTLENQGAAPVVVESVTVVDAQGEPLAFRGDALAKLWKLFPATPPAEGAAKPAPGVLAPGDTALVYLWRSAKDVAGLPTRLGHTVTLAGSPTPVELAPVEVLGADTVPALGPPMAGAGWFVINSPEPTSRHRRSVQRIDGGRYMAQRYAVDFVRVLSESGTFVGDPKVNASYSAYGAEVLAMADGVIVAVHDGIPENVPGAEERAVPMSLETLAGNYVVLDLGGERFVTYAHLQPGSLRVAVGQRVARGEVLGLLGNSGNSTEPHLHLHVCDAPSALRCQGRPWALERFVEQEVKLPTTPTGVPTVTDPVVRERAIPVHAGYLVLSGPDDAQPTP